MLDPNNAQDAKTDARLRENIITWFTTVRSDGRPHSFPVMFLWDGASVLIFSKPKSQKLVNLRHNANVVLALDDTKEGDDVVIVEGTAELVNDAGLTAATHPGYLAKYGALFQETNWTPERLAEFSQAIRVTPTRVITY